MSSEETGDKGLDLLEEEERKLVEEFEQIWNLERHQQKKRGWLSFIKLHGELDIDDIKRFLSLVILITMMIVLTYITLAYVYH